MKHYRDRPLTAEDMERRYQRLYVWPQALHEAYQYDTTKLSTYLRLVAQGKNPLDREQLEQLVDLLDRRIHHRVGESGRKPGRIPPRDPDAITSEYVAALARAEKERMKRENGGKTPRGVVARAIETVCQRLGDDGYSLTHINEGQVVDIIRRSEKPRRPPSDLIRK
jgi:hypothetical protein